MYVDDHCVIEIVLADNLDRLEEKIQEYLRDCELGARLRLGSISHHTEPAFSSALITLVYRRKVADT